MANIMNNLSSNTILLISTCIYGLILLLLILYLVYLQNNKNTLTGIRKVSGIKGSLGVESSSTN
jgi:hypothetical protein|tara:strand:- start:533 stop:724 length:192 start_codon:yes stop_codon:yes gene_type:complete